MNWYRQLKIATSTLGVLMDIQRSGVFVSRRFSSYMATGCIGFFEYTDGQVYEVKIEGVRDGLDHASRGNASSGGNDASREIASKLKAVFKTAREDVAFGGEAAFIGIGREDGEPYKISVQLWHKSPHRNYFVDTKSKQTPQEQAPTPLTPQPNPV